MGLIVQTTPIARGYSNEFGDIDSATFTKRRRRYHQSRDDIDLQPLPDIIISNVQAPFWMSLSSVCSKSATEQEHGKSNVSSAIPSGYTPDIGTWDFGKQSNRSDLLPSSNMILERQKNVALDDPNHEHSMAVGAKTHQRKQYHSHCSRCCICQCCVCHAKTCQHQYQYHCSCCSVNQYCFCHGKPPHQHYYHCSCCRICQNCSCNSILLKKSSSKNYMASTNVGSLYFPCGRKSTRFKIDAHISSGSRNAGLVLRRLANQFQDDYAKILGKNEDDATITLIISQGFTKSLACSIFLLLWCRLYNKFR